MAIPQTKQTVTTHSLIEGVLHAFDEDNLSLIIEHENTNKPFVCRIADAYKAELLDGLARQQGAHLLVSGEITRDAATGQLLEIQIVSWAEPVAQPAVPTPKADSGMLGWIKRDEQSEARVRRRRDPDE